VTGGFGWSFYGFFLFAIVWIAAYFAWAAWMNRKTGAGDRGTGTTTEGPRKEATEIATETPTERHKS
jgi:hypothetical protein